jgi:hypothetical protein
MTACWICQEGQATTREHRIKHSDLRSIFGSPSKGVPFYYSNPKQQNVFVQSLDAKLLKSPALICEHCNSARTQPHDRAWEQLSNWLRLRPAPLQVGGRIRGDKIFRYDTRRQMLNVHIFFLKLFGGMIVESAGKLPIPIEPFSDAIMSGRWHEEVYLQFGKGDGSVGILDAKPLTTSGGKLIYLWFYRIGTVVVNVIYAQHGEYWENLDKTWHPKWGKSNFVVADLRPRISQHQAHANETAAVAVR